jgi:hypothetical protein
MMKVITSVSPLELQNLTIHLSMDELKSPLTHTHHTFPGPDVIHNQMLQHLVMISWIPGHVGIAGIEMTDTVTSCCIDEGTLKFKIFSLVT